MNPNNTQIEVARADFESSWHSLRIASRESYDQWTNLNRLFHSPSPRIFDASRAYAFARGNKEIAKVNVENAMQTLTSLVLSDHTWN